MEVEDEINKILKKLKRKQKKGNFFCNDKNKQNLIDDMLKEYDVENSDDFLCTVQDVMTNNYKLDDKNDLQFYKNVYNDFESDISYFFDKYVDKIINSSFNNKKSFIKKEKTIDVPSNIIHKQLNYNVMHGQILRNFERTEKYFKPMLMLGENYYSDSSTSSDNEEQRKKIYLKDITKKYKLM
ncbi:conserved protein, unknown function [Hepatocystis sp. ex Piliocolobus tephrosceles]|nr:conserved protein, unknown function [Hepatocystis sp. ex Piliocolobus tephrosceles]